MGSPLLPTELSSGMTVVTKVKRIRDLEPGDHFLVPNHGTIARVTGEVDMAGGMARVPCDADSFHGDFTSDFGMAFVIVVQPAPFGHGLF